MTELAYSRCKDCSPKAWQCSSCAKLDVTVRKNMKEARKRATSPVVLFTSPTAPLLLTHVYPPMPAPAALSLYGQVVFPPVVPAVPNIVNVVPLVVPAVSNIVTVVPRSLKRKHDMYDAESDSDESHHRASAKQQATPKTPKTSVRVVSSSDSDDSSSSSSSNSQTGDEDEDAAKKLAPKQKMPRITKEERACVCEWIQKDRKDSMRSSHCANTAGQNRCRDCRVFAGMLFVMFLFMFHVCFVYVE